jgi:hypothetical protein
MVESAAYHHKKAVSTSLIILYKGHYLGDPMVKGLMNPNAEFNATTG